MTEQLLPPANWYADPEGTGRWRYWDGAAWTGVYLNQPEQGRSVLAQWWAKVEPWAFLAGIVGLTVAIAVDSDWFSLFLVLTVLGMPQNGGKTPIALRGAFPAAVVVGMTIHAGWQVGAGLAVCAVAAGLVGMYRKRLQDWIAWPVLAFSMVGFGVLWLAGSDWWRG